MLIRARELKDTITDFLETQFPAAQALKLSLKEWKQIEYLIDLVKPFAFFTHKIGTSSGPTVHHVYNIYEALFSHLEQSKNRLEKKVDSQPWIKILIKALNRSHMTLRHWFTATYTNLGTFYAIGTILSPSYKTDPFEQVSFERQGLHT